MYKLFYDTETGGTNEKEDSLLTAFFAVCDDEFNVIDELYLKLKPSDPSQLNVNDHALKVNGIDIDKHLNDPDTVTYEEGAEKLLELFKRNKIPRKRKSLQPCGHNILGFDNAFIWEQLMSKSVWSKYVHYRTLDTSGITAFLKDIGMLPQEVGSLTSLVDYYGIPMKEAHNAKDDVLMNIKVYRSMVSSIKDVKKEIASTNTGGSNSLLEIIEV